VIDRRTFATVVSMRSCFTSCDTIVLPMETNPVSRQHTDATYIHHQWRAQRSIPEHRHTVRGVAPELAELAHGVGGGCGRVAGAAAVRVEGFASGARLGGPGRLLGLCFCAARLFGPLGPILCPQAEVGLNRAVTGDYLQQSSEPIARRLIGKSYMPPVAAP
jgi:hypothetical protein